MFSSLWNRRAIGTTGVRILLDFDVDNQPMGETIRVQTPPKRMNIRAHGTAPLAKVVVVKNNQDWHVVETARLGVRFHLGPARHAAGPGRLVLRAGNTGRRRNGMVEPHLDRGRAPDFLGNLRRLFSNSQQLPFKRKCDLSIPAQARINPHPCYAVPACWQAWECSPA